MRDLLAELIQRRRPLYCQSVYTLPPEPGAAPAPAAVTGTAVTRGAARGSMVAVAEPPAAAGTVVTAEIGRAHVCTPVTNAQLVCRLLLEKKKHSTQTPK